MNTNDTICAVATAQGGAIGVIRVSGAESIEVTGKIFSSVKGKKLSEMKPYTLVYGNIVDKDGGIVDDVMVSVFRAPHSYTGEDGVEISCHGSSYILQKVMQMLVENGCRTARPGEFTQRAFLNGKMDLSQAEAVADVIASSNAANHRMAMTQMKGGFSTELRQLREELLHLTSLMELELDFSDHEELEFADRRELTELTDKVEQVISRLVNSFRVGNAIKNGIPVAIVGETNVGKSTLLNALLNEERAIVSDIHGTTRDVIEDTININGVSFRFFDTAGIRETTNTIENIGIERTFQKFRQAEVVMWLLDVSKAEEQFAQLSSQILEELQEHQQLLLVINKADLMNDASVLEALQTKLLEKCPESVQSICISARNTSDVEALQKQLVALPCVSMCIQQETDVIVSNQRHYEALYLALEAIHRVQFGLQSDIPCDLLAQDLRASLYHLAEIVGGEITTDEVLGVIFSKFCIGK